MIETVRGAGYRLTASPAVCASKATQHKKLKPCWLCAHSA